jgi:hypothetical protein
MGFKLPGKSIISGTSAHSSALKMKAEANAAAKMKREAAAKLKKDSPVDKTLVGKQHNLPEELKAKIEAAPGKMKPSPVKESFSQAYRSNRDAGKKYFTYKGKEYTTESRSEKAEREKTGKTYAELNPKKSMTKTVKDKDPIAESIKKSNPIGPREGTKKEKVDVAKKNVKNVKKEAKANVKDVKKEGKIKTLKAKQKVAETKGRSRRAERLERKIERKETGKTRREQRQDRRTAKKANEKARSSEVANEAVKNANKAIEKQKGNSPITMKPGRPRSKSDKEQFTKADGKATRDIGKKLMINKMNRKFKDGPIDGPKNKAK